jgi:vacuolar-type H+-ATPase subunit I/STV1
MKSLTREQLQARKEQAVRFTANVLGDSDRADEIADESLEDYAERRKIQLTNPQKRRGSMPSKQDLQDQIADLQDQNDQLQDQLDAIADIIGPTDDDSTDDDNGNGDDSD